MKKLFWLIPGKLAGRAGPVVDPWDAEDLRLGGITTIVSTDEDCHPKTIAEAGIKHICQFMPTPYPTTPDLVDRFVGLVTDATGAVLTLIERGETVMVHCYAGRDRTGLVLSAVLMALEGLDAKAAVAKVRTVRPSALTGPGVLDVLLEYERLFKKNRK